NPEIIQNHPFVMPLYPMSNYLAIISLLLIVVFMFINPDTRASVTVGFVFLMVLTINFIIKFRRKRG
ncbi:amino acid permease, partial [Enterococcus faecium]|nr:amino acid permease [Enterococcus faecium]